MLVLKRQGINFGGLKLKQLQHAAATLELVQVTLTSQSVRLPLSRWEGSHDSILLGRQYDRCGHRPLGRSLQSIHMSVFCTVS